MRRKHMKELRKLQKENPDAVYELRWVGECDIGKYNNSHLIDLTATKAINHVDKRHKEWVRVDDN